MITIAPSKGRILPKHCRSWQLPVVVPLEDPETSRKLLIGTKPSGYPNCGWVRASDVPTYVQYGAADMGSSG